MMGDLQKKVELGPDLRASNRRKLQVEQRSECQTKNFKTFRK